MKQPQRILIMGLPGAGKTFLATALKQFLETQSTFKHMPMSRSVNMEMVPT